MKHISDCLPAELSAVLVEARNRGSDMRAPARPATGIVATAHLSGGEENSRLRASREGTAAQTEWKGTPTEAGAKSSDASREVREHRAYAVGTAKQRTSRDWRLISASLTRIVRNKHVAPPTRYAPALATCLFLVIDNANHATVSGAR